MATPAGPLSPPWSLSPDESLERLGLLFHLGLEKIFEGFVGGRGQILPGSLVLGEVASSFWKQRPGLIPWIPGENLAGSVLPALRRV